MRNVLITGASGGIGSAAVRRFSELGWRVFAGVRSRDQSAALASVGSDVHPVELDVSVEASSTQARDVIERELADEGLHALINNAGLTVDGPVEMVPVEALRRQFEVNVFGQVAVTQAFLPLLRRGGGRVVNVGGAAGRSALPMYGPLSASKAALDALSDALRMELKYQGVKVSYIEPGAIATNFFAKAGEHARTAGYAGEPAIKGIYARAIQSSAAAMLKTRTTPVDAAVNAIIKAATNRRPRARYIVGFEVQYGLPILRALPTGIRDRVLMRSLGLGRHSFDAGAEGER